MRKFLFVFIAVALFGTGNAFAFMYDVTGMAEIFGEECAISGYMEITDEPDVGLPATSDRYFTYMVLGFNIYFGDYNFTSVSDKTSMINSIHYSYAEPHYTTPFDCFWLNGEGDFTNWSALAFGANFYDKNGTPYDKGADYSDFMDTPYAISFTGVMELDGSGAFFTDLNIQRSDVPVPEPSTMLLVGTGLIGLLGFRFQFEH